MNSPENSNLRESPDSVKPDNVTVSRKLVKSVLEIAADYIDKYDFIAEGGDHEHPYEGWENQHENIDESRKVLDALWKEIAKPRGDN